MPTDNFASAADEALEALLRLGTADWNDWREEDLAAILLGQLRQPLSQLFRQMLGERAASVLALAGVETGTLEDLLHAPSPSPQLLQLAKDYAKSAPRHPTDAVPRDVAKVLYFAAISVAQRHGHRISALPHADVCDGIEWACRLTWVDRRTKAALKPTRA